MAPSNRRTIASHLNNLLRKLGPKADGPVDRITAKDIKAFIQIRLRERAAVTVAKERSTVIGFFEWCVVQNFAPTSPALALTRLKSGGDRPPFRTRQELDAVIARGGLSAREEYAAWDCLYLAPDEIAGLLALVTGRAKDPLSFLLHAIPAYTGMRRGEVLRLRWADVEFDHDGVWARSLKQSRQAIETKRRIDLHPELRSVLLDWRAGRPKGQFVACDGGTPDALTACRADSLFVQPLRGTTWEVRADRFKVGFHTYRHSFASNLAAAGVDQRLIDEFLGHTTEGMRKRYRHLFPNNKRSAMRAFSLKTPSNHRPAEPG